MKKMAGMLLVCFLLTGCNTPKPGTNQEEMLKALQEHPEIIRQQVIKTLQENPKVVLDVLNNNSIELLQIVEKGGREQAVKKREDQLKQDLANPKKPVIDMSRPFMGDPGAPITIVEYSDFQCFYCAKAASTVQELMKKYPHKIRLFFKHMPFHEMSKTEALCFEAISKQSVEKAWKFYEMAFDRREDIMKEKESALQEIVSMLDIDNARLKTDMESKELSDRIADDMKEARSFGFDATPSFLINGVSVVGAVPLEEFEKVIRLAEEKK